MNFKENRHNRKLNYNQACKTLYDRIVAKGKE